MGVQWVKSAVMGQTAQVAATATTTAAQTAGLATTTAASTAAAATTTAAWTPAAIVASIGSFGGAAAIGVGAVLGALAMGIAGKRKNGGHVSAGSIKMYEVGENGLPEIFQASNGRQYMIPGNDGYSVISNKDLTGGGSGVVVYNNVINNSSAQVSSSARDNGDGSVTIETIVRRDIENNGPIGASISRNYSVKPESNRMRKAPKGLCFKSYQRIYVRPSVSSLFQFTPCINGFHVKKRYQSLLDVTHCATD